MFELAREVSVLNDGDWAQTRAGRRYRGSVARFTKLKPLADLDICWWVAGTKPVAIIDHQDCEPDELLSQRPGRLNRVTRRLIDAWSRAHDAGKLHPAFTLEPTGAQKVATHPELDWERVSPRNLWWAQNPEFFRLDQVEALACGEWRPCLPPAATPSETQTSRPSTLLPDSAAVCFVLFVYARLMRLVALPAALPYPTRSPGSAVASSRRTPRGPNHSQSTWSICGHLAWS